MEQYGGLDFRVLWYLCVVVSGIDCVVCFVCVCCWRWPRGVAVAWCVGSFGECGHSVLWRFLGGHVALVAGAPPDVGVAN